MAEITLCSLQGKEKTTLRRKCEGCGKGPEKAIEIESKGRSQGLSLEAIRRRVKKRNGRREKLSSEANQKRIWKALCFTA